MRTEHDDTVTVSAIDVHEQRLVCLYGEVDLAAREQIDAACLAGNEFDVVIDLAGATFMDCAGYASLLLARRELIAVGGTATIRNAQGQPARLLEMIDHFECASRDIADSRGTATATGALPSGSTDMADRHVGPRARVA